MWMIFALLSALFAGITAILSKIGVKSTDSTVATALRTVVVLVFSWVLVWMQGLQEALPGISGRTYLFLGLSGLATGASWLCYFRALKLGPVSQVTAVDKSSTIMTMLLAFLFLGEPLGAMQLLAMALILPGTLLMVEKKPEARKYSADGKTGHTWLLYAVFSAVFAALTAILGKVGIQGIPSNLGTALRTIVVLVMAWMMVFVQGKQKEIRGINPREGLMIGLSGLATGASWLCYYRALQDGPASVVVPLDKLSIVVTVVFSVAILRERLSRRAWAGLGMIVAGTLLLTL